jgi:hypothetical protein
VYTISFYSKAPDGLITQLKSKGEKYQSLDDARRAAREALEKYPNIAFAYIYASRSMGPLEKVERNE